MTAAPKNKAVEPRSAKTRPSQSGVSRPRLPHEHDESAETQATQAQQDIGEKAFADATGPTQDTGWGPVMEATGRRLKKAAPKR